MNLNAISVDQVGEQIALLLSAGLMPSKEVSTDPAVVKKSWHLALRHLPLDAVEQAVAEIIGENRKYMPVAGEVAAVARRFVAQAPRAIDRGNGCMRPGCTCSGVGIYVSQLREDGPMARFWTQHEAQERGLIPVEDVRCPYEGCHCHAIECEVPTTYEPPHRRFSKGGAPISQRPTHVGQLGTAEVRIPMMRLFLWECEAGRIGAKIVAVAA